MDGARCPVSEDGGTCMLLGHRDVVTAATDPVTFSSSVTSRRAIPNSLDGEEHAAYRSVVDRYLTGERVAALEPAARRIAADVVDALARGETVAAITQIGTPFAVRVQSAWLGWPRELENDLVAWGRENQAASRSGDHRRTAAVAEKFGRIIRDLLEPRRDAPVNDVTGELMRDAVHGRPLSDDEIVSNRRRTTRPVEVGGRRIEEGTRVVLNWTAANRDPQVFGDPDRFEPDANAGANLVFGIGPHACPGRALTLLELRTVTEAVLTGTTLIEPAPERHAIRETRPLGGWTRVPVVLH